MGHLKCTIAVYIKSFGGQRGGSSEPLEPPLPTGLCSVINFSVTFERTSTVNHVVVLIFGTIYGIWNLDFFRYLIPPFCATDQISPLQVVALEYTVAFYPLLLTAIAYICVQLHARDCQVCGVCFVSVSAAVDEGGEDSGTQ